MKRSKRRGLKTQIRAIADALHREWDPIGCALSRRFPKDEYDSYAPVVAGMLERGATDRAIAHYLSSVESEEMGLTARNVSVLDPIVRRIRNAAGIEHEQAD